MSRTVPKYPGLYHEILPNGEKRYRIVITHKGQVTQRYYYYGKLRTKKAALEHAQTEWQELRETMPVVTPELKVKLLQEAKPSARIPGVRRITSVSKGREYEFWTSAWSDKKGQRHTRRFSIAKYGVRKAKELAIEARLNGLLQATRSR